MNDSSKISITEAANIAHLTRQAIYAALKKGRLKGHQEGFHWYTTEKDLEAYRESKHIRENRIYEGKLLYDAELGTFSIYQAATLISHHLKTPYPPYKLYYLIRIGKIEAYKKGCAIIIMKEQILKIIRDEQEKASDPQQLRFA